MDSSLTQRSLGGWLCSATRIWSYHFEYRQCILRLPCVEGDTRGLVLPHTYGECCRLDPRSKSVAGHMEDPDVG